MRIGCKAKRRVAKEIEEADGADLLVDLKKRSVCN
jgi:hypothetical protein